MRRMLIDTYRVWRNEFKVIRADLGVMIFLFLLPFAYPLVYSAIYNPETARNVRVVVVDDNRTALTREYARHLNATQELSIIGYASNMQEARRAMAEKECYGIIHFPADFSGKVYCGEQSVVEVFCDMSLLLRYRSMLVAVTAVASEMGKKIQVERMEGLTGGMTTVAEMPIPFKLVPVGNVSQGLASALMPGVLVLILQQCLILAICFLGATSCERARLNGGRDPMAVTDAGVMALLIGKALCYFVLILVPAIFIIHFVPIIFTFPMNASILDLIAFFVPYLLAVIFFGMVIQMFVPDRESTFLMFVFTSLAFIFLSGISWPRYAMSGFWQLAGGIIPSTWGVTGFVGMNTAGASLSQQSMPYIMLWILAALYFIFALLLSVFWGTAKKTSKRKNVKNKSSLVSENSL